MKRILIGATLVVAGIVGVAGASTVSAEDHDDVPVQVDDKVCEPKTEHIKPAEGTKSVTVTAEDPAQLISGYCVKAGSVEQGLGPEYVTLPLPVRTLTFEYSGAEKNISHYVIFYTPTPVQVTPVKPPSQAPTCAAAGTVQELANTAAYTYNYVTADGVTTVTVTAKTDYVLTGDTGPWTYPITRLTENCDVASNPPPATPPAAVVPPAAPTDRPPVMVESSAVASAGPAPAQAAPVAAPAQPSLTALPATGTSSWVLAFIAMALVLVGSGFVSFSRRFS